MLDLRVPVWIEDLQFLNEEGTRIATATHYHQVSNGCLEWCMYTGYLYPWDRSVYTTSKHNDDLFTIMMLEAKYL